MKSDHPAPRRAPGEARLEMRVAGICDTDLQLARGYMGFRGVPGHEFVGEVVESDDPSWLGRRAVADINAGCGNCADCVSSDGHHCKNRSVLGIAGRDGALAEQVVVPERCLVAVPESVSDERAVFAEPLAAALHVLDELESSALPVIILGDGKLGLLIAMALARAGVDVTAVGRHAHKLALAGAAGASTVLEADSEQLRGSAALVVEATGSAGGLKRAIELCRPKGKIVLKTTVSEPLLVDLAPLVIHEQKLVGSRCGNMARAIDVLAQGGIDPTALIAARYPLARADQALAQAATQGMLKVLVEGSS
jgi:2-desacetyl-2-hydroxyethyl bacteriochlorophyllide A dehydrogenase